MVNMLFRMFLMIALCTTVLAAAKNPHQSRRNKHSKSSKDAKRRWQLDDACGRPKDDVDFNPENLSPLDTCCDKRNNCVDQIKSNEFSERFHLHNDDSMSRVSCKCEHAFYDCLHGLRTPRANAIGWMYYSQYRNPKCFNYDYPALGCDEWINDGISNPRCKKYEVDKHKPLKYEWRDLPHYEDAFPSYPEYEQPDNLDDTLPVEDESLETTEEFDEYSDDIHTNSFARKLAKNSKNMNSPKSKRVHKEKLSKKSKRKHSRKMK